jgi:hypothetical protein
MLWIGMLIASASANEIILPDFHGTPGSSEAGPEIVYSAMVEALSDRDIAFLDANDLRTFLGDAAEDCPARSECPGNLWMDIEGELALLGTVTMTDAQITATIEYYQQRPHPSRSHRQSHRQSHRPPRPRPSPVAGYLHAPWLRTMNASTWDSQRACTKNFRHPTRAELSSLQPRRFAPKHSL